MPTIYEFLKANKYYKFKIANRDGSKIYIDKEKSFDDLEIAMTYGDTEEEEFFEKISEYTVLTVDFWGNIIYCDY